MKHDEEIRQTLISFTRKHPNGLSALAYIAQYDVPKRVETYRYRELAKFLLRASKIETITEQMALPDILLNNKRIINELKSIKKRLDIAKNIKNFSDFTLHRNDLLKDKWEISYEDIPEIIISLTTQANTLEKSATEAQKTNQSHANKLKIAETVARTIPPAADFIYTLESAKLESEDLLHSFASAAGSIIVYGRLDNPPTPVTEKEKSFIHQIKNIWDLN